MKTVIVGGVAAGASAVGQGGMPMVTHAEDDLAQLAGALEHV